jgi:O-antigen/teichoic acid export membrane protein
MSFVEQQPETLSEADLAPDAPPAIPARGGKVSRNVRVTMLARAGYMLTRVCIPPFVLARIGLEAYGIWATAFILVTYLGVSTLGVSQVYIKYVAEYSARREYARANQLLSTGLLVTIPLCAALFALICFGWNWFSPLLHLPAPHAADGKEAILIVLGVFLSSISLNAFTDVLSGAQEISAAQWIWTISYIVEMVLLFWLVGTGRGIRGLAEAYLARTIVNDGLSYIWMRHKLKWVSISFRHMRRDALKQVLHFGGLVQLQSMLSIFLASVERVAGLVFIGVSAAGLFDIARKWPLSVSSLPMSFFGAVLPAASHVDAHGSPAQRRWALQDLYMKCSRYSNLTTAYFCGLMVTMPAPIMNVWLGQTLAHAVTLFCLFSIALQFHMLTGPGTSILRGMGRVYDEFFYSIPNLVFLAVFLAIARLAQHQWTVMGIGYSVVAATILSSLVLLARVHNVLDIQLSGYLRGVILPGLLPYLVGGVMAYPITFVMGRFNRIEGLLVLLLTGSIYTVLTFLLVHRFVLQPRERRMLSLKQNFAAAS